MKSKSTAIKYSKMKHIFLTILVHFSLILAHNLLNFSALFPRIFLLFLAHNLQNFSAFFSRV